MRSIGAQEWMIIFLAIPGLISVAFTLIAIVPFWRIFTRAGLPKEVSLLMLVPILNLGVLYYLAFTEWPSLRDCKPTTAL